MKNSIKSRREEMGLSVIELAESCQVSRQTVYSIEKNVYKPTITLALKIATQLEASIEDLFVLEKGDWK